MKGMGFCSGARDAVRVWVIFLVVLPTILWVLAG